MIERHVIFKVLPGKGADFTKYFEDQYRPAMAKNDGFIRAELLKVLDSDSDYMMMLRFEDQQAAAAWRASSAHQELKPGLKALYNDSELMVLQVLVQG